MQNHITKTSFGTITIAGKTYDHDVIIRLNGTVKKRKTKLSKAVYGSSHTVSIDEARYIYEKGAERIIIGSGHYGILKLSNEAEEFFRRKECPVVLAPTPKAVEIWNEAEKRVIGMFHVTC